MENFLNRNKKIEMLTIVLSALCYISGSLLLFKLGGDSTFEQLDGTTMDLGFIFGVLSQIQVLLSVFLCLREHRLGYRVALILNVFGIVHMIFTIWKSQSLRSVPGLITYLSVILVIHLINRYKVHVKEQYQRLKVTEKALKEMAFFDDLTKILNRKMFIEQLNMQIAFAQKKNQRFYVVFIDVDNFKTINDTLGHHVGDFVLKELTKRIQSPLHEEDVIGRMGGDEIGLIITRDMEKKELSKYIRQIKDHVTKSIFHTEQEVTITASFGVAEYPVNGINSTMLLKSADIAMYYSKRRGRNKITYCNEKVKFTM